MLCPLGRVAARRGLATCERCAAGRFSVFAGDRCEACPVGRRSLPGAAECEAEAEGSSCEAPGMAMCDNRGGIYAHASDCEEKTCNPQGLPGLDMFSNQLVHTLARVLAFFE